MQKRYGLDRRPIGRWIGAALLTLAFVAALVWVAVALSGHTVQSRLIAWDDVAADRVNVTIEISRPAADEVTCVIRAQDENRIDVGYATLVVPAGEARVITTYALRTLAPAYTAELLGCGTDGPGGVPPPQFPPGVVPPDQPYGTAG